MAQVVLGGLGGLVGGGVGRILGGALGRVVDNGLIGALEPAREGPRLEGLKVQGTAEGAPMACAFGRARVTGQIVWAARFLERRNESGGGKGGPRSVDYDYSLSFAVALCEGPIDGIGRVWADGKPLATAGIALRLYRGTEDQTPDPLIEAVEGAGAAPAYRGTAYVVFEDLPLGPFGNRPPQLSFEVFRRAPGLTPGLEELMEGVCLIPGAGEFVLATEPVTRREGLTRTASENVHHSEGRPDLAVSLDQLLAQAPNLKRVSLVVGWFGTSLRAGECEIRPGVERRDKPTEPLSWSVAGLDRSNAHLISTVDGRPAYGGTPSDETVRQAIRLLKSRGLEVTLYPFVFMDAPGYPWRGRIAGDDGAEAAGQIEALFGAADGWGLRRMARHYATLAAETGAHGLLIGSEMRGVTWTRDAEGGFPAVAQLKALAAECRGIVGPGVKLSYAADWSEYFGRQAGGEAIFHLDPLWADANIDYVGIDWYPPLSDWRAGAGGLDGETWAGKNDPAYLAAGVAGGEGFDWFYADAADRAAQVRTPIVDTAHGEHWLFRPKDLFGWWSNPHHDRPGGVRAATPTAWVPRMKPIRLTEVGCAAVDRGANAPNLFQDPKSSENALPPHSDGGRDDTAQRRALEAILGHYARAENNPESGLYDGRMLEAADLWCWDARPYPAFPALDAVWADASAWNAGHWLNGRLVGAGADLIAAVLRRGGVEDFTVTGVEGAASGYVIDRPMRTREALAPLLTAFDVIAAERDGRVAVVGREAAGAEIALDDLALPDDGASMRAERRLEPRATAARVRFIDETADYQTGAATVRTDDDGEEGGRDLDLPVVCAGDLAQAVATRLLQAEGEDALALALDPLGRMRLEPGDVVAVEGRAGVWRVERISADETPTARLVRLGDGAAPGGTPGGWTPGEPPAVAGAPFVRLLDLPPLVGFEDDDRPLAAVAVEPWRPMRLHAGPSVPALTVRATVETPVAVGRLVEPLAPGVVYRWDQANSLRVAVEGAAPESAAEAAVLAGANLVAVEAGEGWELIQFRQATLEGATLEGAGLWRLSGLLRGQQGTEAERAAGAARGAIVVFLNAGVARARFGREERGLPLVCRTGPSGQPPGGAGFAQTLFTPRGSHHRPWRPAGLTARDDGAGGQVLTWTARARRYGDSWEGEAGAPDAARWRVDILKAGETVRSFETMQPQAAYTAAMRAEDFAGGGGARARVRQWGEGFGWGQPAEIALD